MSFMQEIERKVSELENRAKAGLSHFNSSTFCEAINSLLSDTAAFLSSPAIKDAGEVVEDVVDIVTGLTTDNIAGAINSAVSAVEDVEKVISDIESAVEED